MNKCLLHLGRGVKVDQSDDTTDIQLDEPESLLELLMGIRVGASYQSIDHSKAAVSTKAHCSVGDDS